MGLQRCRAKLETDGAYAGTTHADPQQWCWPGRPSRVLPGCRRMGAGAKSGMLSRAAQSTRWEEAKGPCWTQGEASPLQLAHLYFSRGTVFFSEEQWRVCQARLHRPDGVPVTKKKPFFVGRRRWEEPCRAMAGAVPSPCRQHAERGRSQAKAF